MSRTARIVIGMIVVVLVVVFIGFVYVWVSGGSGTPSEAITADAVNAEGNATVFEIVPQESEVRFILKEDLNGSRNTVTGKTDQIAGQIAIDFENPARSQLGEIRINARTLSTDNEFRNRAIRGQILQASQAEFEYITFKPTSIEGLPTTLTLGEPVEFQITGDLTIRSITKPITFDAAVTPVSQTRLQGTAVATAKRADYELTIPSVPNVANVDEDVRLEIEFAAVPAAESTAAAS